MSGVPKYWAHSDASGLAPDEPGAKWQALSDHLKQVGDLAERLGLAAGGSPEFARRARAAGLLHDLGKYSGDFQKLLKGEVKRAPHSIFGAALSLAKARATDVGFAVAGHHGGMPDPVDLKDRVAKASSDAGALWPRAVEDCPELAECFSDRAPLLGVVECDRLAFDLHCRMLLSCLVDADRTDTAAHAGGRAEGATQELDPARRLEKLLWAVEARAAQVREGTVKRARREVLEACLAAGGGSARLCSLTVPTGGGKTLASMAFALRRAVANPEVRRVIVVIPYLSIIEQNARVFAEALGDDVVLEHHSGTIGGDAEESAYDNPERRAATENWDAPVIVTTSVRFFESLFSNHPRDVRRLHNIARSVVILDEVQTLPRRYVKATLSMIEGLAEHWGVTFVFCTATQPALERRGPSKDDPRWAPGRMLEIVPKPGALFAALRRVETDWRAAKMSWAAVADELASERQALAIVNTRRQAADLYRELAGRVDGAIHLSNNMCPAHRLVRIHEIRDKLRRGERCLVVSTQLVEAGVDLDFPVVWRALGPLDSIAQAAGRCDREGRLTEALGRPGGRLVVFEPEEENMPPGVYREGAEHARVMAAAGDRDWSNPETIRRYFDRLYRSSDSLDPREVEEKRKALKFKTVSDEVRWIEESTRPVIVPFDDEARELIREIRFAGVSLGRFRRAQRYTVSLWEHEFRRGKALGSVQELVDGKDVWACKEGLYDERLGIRLEGADGKEMVV